MENSDILQKYYLKKNNGVPLTIDQIAEINKQIYLMRLRRKIHKYRRLHSEKLVQE
jgi:hypothetical protein